MSTAQARKVAFGAYVEGADSQPALIDNLSSQVGRRPAIVLSYKDWRSVPFDSAELSSIWRRGAVPMITWEPQTPHGGVPLRVIAAGRFDRYLRRSAGSARNWGRPLLVRFAHEMNGGWYPWGNGVGGNTPADFRMAWHRVVAIFHHHGADNVRWVWSPNEDSGGTLGLRPFFPGDASVDWVALDGFNFGDDQGWPSFTRLFASSYERLTELTSRPLMIAETGSSEEGGDKAQWVSSALEREAPGFSRLRAIVWFNSPVPSRESGPASNFLIDSSPSALRAFRDAIRTPTYGMSRTQLLAIPRSIPGSAAAPPEPEEGYGAPSVLERLRAELEGHWGWLVLGAIAAGALAAFLVFEARRRRASGESRRAA